MFPKRFESFLFSAILSGLMSLLVSGISTLKAVEPTLSNPSLWITTWLSTWLSAWIVAWWVACPAVIVIGPIARQWASRLTKHA
ncbi:DUF2798 domain-containing protein [Limnobacter humi]|uniref:DUF2798 domain-containing protein n=1 Tax=Limnobacter humi TaxID=1778671 RepID=A0ABT1WJI8_9BURK|nr:DUF2798 domain-containing protein [Limnobacter humi]MCQ8897678.1 DUF2798 domain-containing protein [Limnobacter humi]